MREIEREIASALVFSKDQKLLMGKKDPKAGGVYPDCWHIPGGGVDEGETLEQAMIREVKEEVGLDISDYQIEKVSDNEYGRSEKKLQTGEIVIVNMHFNVFRVDISDKVASEIRVILNDDLVEYRWFEQNEFASIKQMDAGVRLFRKLGFI